MADPIAPVAGDLGRASADPAGLARTTLASWDSLLTALDATPGLDPGRPGRKHSVRHTLAVLGTWPESRSLADLREDAAHGRTDAPARDDIDARVVQAHAQASLADLVDAIARTRQELAAWFADPDYPEEALRHVGGPLGVVPLGTLIGATEFQVAIAILDLEPAGVSVDPGVVDDGLLALLDSTGAVLSTRVSGTDALALTVVTPERTASARAVAGAWRLDVDLPTTGATLRGRARSIVDIAAGRLSAPVAYARGEVRAEDLPGLLRVAKALASAAGLPGTEGLRAAIAAYDRLGGLGGLVARLPFSR